MATQNWETEIAELRRLEEAVRGSDDAMWIASADGVRARWESGRYLVTLRQGKKKLPSGLLRRLGELSTEFQFHRSELTARMKLPTKFTTEDELANVISQYGLWPCLDRTEKTESGSTSGGRIDVRRVSGFKLLQISASLRERQQIATR